MKKGQNKMVVASKNFQIVVETQTMIYIFPLCDSRERILAYKTHFGASVILIKQQKNGTTTSRKLNNHEQTFFRGSDIPIRSQ